MADFEKGAAAFFLPNPQLHDAGLTHLQLEVIAREEALLNQLGYKQVLYRGWRTLTQVCVTISSMSVLLSVYGSFGTGLYYGGPVVCLWAWWMVSLLTLCVGLGMAELASAMPTSGGMYYWMFVLTGEKYGRLLCWVTGWLNLLGQIASLAATHYLMAQVIGTIVLLSTRTQVHDGEPPAGFIDEAESATANGDYDYEMGPGRTFTEAQTLGIYAGCILLTTVLNSLDFHHVGKITEFGAWWTVLGAAVVIVLVPAVATQHADPEWVFRKFITQGGHESGIHNEFYIFCLGLLLSAYCYIGYDGAAHMSEETKDATMAAPKAIIGGIVYMMFFGWIWIMSLLFCVTDWSSVQAYESEAGGAVVAQIFWDAFKQSTGSGKGGIVLILVPLGGIYFCAHSTLTYVSRILFCYARDEAVPLPWLWTRFNERTKSPLIAVWGTALATFLIGLPMLGDEAAFTAIVALSTIALNVAYVVPTLARITWGAKRFRPGPFHLGWWAYPIGWLAVGWVTFIVVIFSLPIEYPVTSRNLNYAGVTMLATLMASLLYYYFPVYGAYKWFKGPVRTVDDDSDGLPSAKEPSAAATRSPQAAKRSANQADAAAVLTTTA